MTCRRTHSGNTFRMLLLCIASVSLPRSRPVVHSRSIADSLRSARLLGDLSPCDVATVSGLPEEEEREYDQELEYAVTSQREVRKKDVDNKAISCRSNAPAKSLSRIRTMVIVRLA